MRNADNSCNQGVLVVIFVLVALSRASSARLSKPFPNTSDQLIPKEGDRK